jgi:erythromycin esterase-like protein
MNPYAWFLGIVVFLSFSAGPSSYAQASDTGRQPFVDWAQQHAIRLKTVEAGHGFEDMEPLRAVVGSARIVALGEATHGTREFFQLKHRMIEFLATQMGFTIFSIEANMPEAYRLNDFVLNGNGDPRDLIKGMYFWTWNTEEVLDMVLWMREFNRSGKGRIEFTGFDMQTPTVSMEIVRAYVLANDTAYFDVLDRTYTDVRRAKPSTQAAFGVATASLPASAVAGKHVRLSGYIRTEGITDGWAGLWLRADGDGRPAIAFDNMQDRAPKGTTPWTRYETALDVPADATAIFFGALHPGDGTAWFDSLRVEVAGNDYHDPKVPDLDFESDSLRGFHTAGAGYQVALDKNVAHSGKQSLRIQRTSQETQAQASTNPFELHKLTRECMQVVEHLEARRAESLRGASHSDIDWVIQNARLVSQYTQLQAGEKSRDASMADNVKWIADRSANGKLVLWAHNGHISYSASGFGGSMGSCLRDMFGRDFMNFGFAFNEGSFRAVGGSLRGFTVPAAPVDTFDGALAATGIPIFALDLRAVPAQGPIGQWLSRPHATRSIGAVYSEANASQYWARESVPSMFEAVLFVDKTTASRALPEPPHLIAHF